VSFLKNRMQHEDKPKLTLTDVRFGIGEGHKL
jgi:hypothetical protein